MLLLNLFVLAMALTVHYDEIHDSALNIKNNTLKGFRITTKLPKHLKLSFLGLNAIHENALANMSNVKTLNLASNNLKTLPSLSCLPNLENLILEDNDLKSGKFYAGLSNLKILNIANNPLRSFEPGHFFGVPKSAQLWTKGLELSFITAAMFENPQTSGNRQPFAMQNKNDVIDEDIAAKPSDQEKEIEIKFCILNGHLTSVENVNNATSLPEECHKIGLNSNTLILNNMGINTLRKEWYQLQDQNVTSISLSDNEIAKFRKELMNDLPDGIVDLYLSRNRIEKLEKGIIENKNDIDILDLRDNLINEIEDGALEKLNLTGGLFLDSNYLRNTKFLDTLPPYIQHVSVNRNKITEISAGNFEKFTRFTSLSLEGNDIKEIKANTLQRFSSLTDISLRMNHIEMIESNAFQDLKNLSYLDLAGNKISRLQEGIFSGLEKIRFIDLYSNRIDEHLTNLLATIPSSLEKLRLGKNYIKARSAEMTSSKSATGLDSRWNRCSDVRRACNTSNLKFLDLQDNRLMEIEGDSFEGLENLTYLSLAGNKIAMVKKGLTKNLSNLYVLDLSDNPIEILRNGALYGLTKDSETIIRVNRVPLKVIQGGLFDYA